LGTNVLTKDGTDFHIPYIHLVGAVETEGLAFWEKECKKLWAEE
jgi:hypothetical protein